MVANSFQKTAGQMSIEVSEPSPRWITIRSRFGEIRGLRFDDLQDLKYLVDRAFVFVEQEEYESRRRRDNS